MSVPSRRTRLSALTAVVLTSALAAGCSAQATSDSSEPQAQVKGPKAPKESVAKISSNINRGAKSVDIDQKVKLRVAKGTLQDVAVTTAKGQALTGRTSPNDKRWVSTGRLTADTGYRVRGTAVDADGLESTYQARFRTRELTLDEQTYPSFVPTEGQTVGVGMPVIIRFDVPVANKAVFEKHLQVTSQPAQPGAFHWLSDNEVHWRPKHYWKPGTKVTVNADIGGVPAGNGIYGQLDRSTSFNIGRSMVTKVNMDTHQMKVFRGGKLVRTMPTTTGEEPKFTTRSGTKVIIEKFRYKRMNSETIGIDPNSADGYDLEKVEYAMRVTYSGEFIHAAPWSVGSQGYANVSHGCTGLSTDNARWLYENTLIGDVVEYTGTNRGTTLGNGYGDWNLSFPTYRAGSALS